MAGRLIAGLIAKWYGLGAAAVSEPLAASDVSGLWLLLLFMRLRTTLSPFY